MQTPFPDRTASDLRLAMALLLEQGGETTLGTGDPYAMEDLAAIAQDLAALAAAVQVLQRWRDQLLEPEALA